MLESPTVRQLLVGGLKVARTASRRALSAAWYAAGVEAVKADKISRSMRSVLINRSYGRFYTAFIMIATGL